MKLKIYKPVLLTAAGLLAACTISLAQKAHTKVKTKAKHVISATVNVDDTDFQIDLGNMAKELTVNLKDFGKNLAATITNNITSNIDVDVNSIDVGDLDIDPKINLNLDKLLNNLNINVSSADDGDDEMENSALSIKEKNYSKSYPLDANDRIRLSNQYGKISVNTWNRNEIKVDISIKAEAGSDADAQRLIDGVSIADGKNADQVSFKTNIQHSDNDNGFWSLFKSNGGNRKHKLSINYVVYMPAKQDLNVEASYGSIDLPDLDGKVRISTSYGSTSVQSLSNPANEISGSYGSLKVGTMNGGKVSFSYGSVDMDEVTNLKADLDYGSFKLGKLKGTGDFDLSYEGGFKIDNVESSLKRLNINTSYSGASLGLAPNSNFDFDVTVSYGGFNYDDDKVNVTSKNPPDGSRHIGSTRNYKGHVGKGTSDAKVTINTSYGGVRFE